MFASRKGFVDGNGVSRKLHPVEEEEEQAEGKLLTFVEGTHILAVFSAVRDLGLGELPAMRAWGNETKTPPFSIPGRDLGPPCGSYL